MWTLYNYGYVVATAIVGGAFQVSVPEKQHAPAWWYMEPNKHPTPSKQDQFLIIGYIQGSLWSYTA